MDINSHEVDEAFKCLIEKSISLSQFLEQKGSRLLSDSPDEKEAILSEVVTVIRRLPNDFLDNQQASLLLHFLLSCLNTSALAGGCVLDGIRYLVLNSVHLPNESALPVVQSLFIDGNVQSWPQKDRMKQYEIFLWLLNNRKNELSSLNKELVVMFIKTVGGERDPRCLLLVFRLFIMVVSSYPIGLFVEDLFEVIACYYPVEFKPLPTENLITRDLLSRSCAKCLIAHVSFAPFCYMLIEEKFADDECSTEQKYDICELLVDATIMFPPNHILPHLTSLLAGLRMIALNPKSKGPIPEVVLHALHAVIVVVVKTGNRSVEIVVHQMLEDLEPFVLQAEMGLCERALCMLRCILEASLTTRHMVLNKTLAWIIMLVQGDTVNTAANRIDVMKEALLHLGEWSEFALNMKAEDILHQIESALFASIDIARETTPSEALITIYRCFKVYLQLSSISDDLGQRCEHSFRTGLVSIQNEYEEASFLEFITSHAEARWLLHKNILEQYADSESEKFILVLCASVFDVQSWINLRSKIMETLLKDPSRTNLNGYVTMANRMVSDKKILLQLADELKELIVNLVSFSPLSLSDPQRRDVVAESMQSIGLLLDQDEHKLLIESVIRQLNSDRPLLSEIFRLLLVQSNDHSILHPLAGITCSSSTHHLFLFALVNKTSSDPLGDIRALTESDMTASCTIAKAHLLAGRKEGLYIVKEILSQMSTGKVDETLIPAICNIFEFSGSESSPERCRYKTTTLWKQRIFCQFTPHYITSITSADCDGLKSLLLILPAILRLAEQIGPTIQEQLNDFLPVFVAALSTKEMPSLAVLTALSSFIKGMKSEQMGREEVAIVLKKLAEIIRDINSQLQPVLLSLECLDLLARRCSPFVTQPYIDIVVRNITRCLGHKKRIVRQKAASVRNLWEMLPSK